MPSSSTPTLYLWHCFGPSSVSNFSSLYSFLPPGRKWITTTRMLFRARPKSARTWRKPSEKALWTACSQTASRPWYVVFLNCPPYLCLKVNSNTSHPTPTSTHPHAHLQQRRQLKEDIIPQLASEPEQAAKMLLEEIPKLAQRSYESLPKNPQDVRTSLVMRLPSSVPPSLSPSYKLIDSPLPLLHPSSISFYTSFNSLLMPSVRFRLPFPPRRVTSSSAHPKAWRRPPSACFMTARGTIFENTIRIQVRGLHILSLLPSLPAG